MHLRENQFERATELFYEAAAVPELWPTALQAVADAAGAMGANLMPVGPGLEAFVCSPDMQGYMEDFLAGGWLKINPYMRRGMELTAAGWPGLITSQDMLTPEQSARDRYINEHRLPGGLGAEAGMVLVRADDAVIPITIDRSPDDGPFTRSEIEKMNKLVAKLKPAGALALKVGLSGSRRVADSLNAIGRDIALLGITGRVIHSPPGFEHHLGDGLTLRRGCLHSWHLETDRRLAAAVEQAVSRSEVAERVPNAIALPRRSSRRPLIARVVPIAGAGQDIFNFARALLIISDPEAQPRNEVDILAATFGLTPAEARLAARIGRAEELKDIAEAEGIAIETSRARLKAVFAKTGTHRQAELAILVAGLRS